MEQEREYFHNPNTLRGKWVPASHQLLPKENAPKPKGCSKVK